MTICPSELHVNGPYETFQDEKAPKTFNLRGFLDNLRLPEILVWYRGPDLNRQAVRRRIFITLRLSTPTSNKTPSTLTTLHQNRSCAGLCLHHCATRCRCPPSSLYTFLPQDRLEATSLQAWLGVASAQCARGFAEFEGFYSDRFRSGTQLFKSAMFTNFITPAGRTRFYHRSAPRARFLCRKPPFMPHRTNKITHAAPQKIVTVLSF